MLWSETIMAHDFRKPSFHAEKVRTNHKGTLTFRSGGKRNYVYVGKGWRILATMAGVLLWLDGRERKSAYF